jgi:hypothetical protein
MVAAAQLLQSFALPIMMIMVCAMNLVVTHKRAESRLSIDGRRLQAALVEELHLLAKLYRSNLDLLERQEVRLISTRMPLAIFRGNIGRITLLNEDAIRRLVGVHANNEHIEMMVSERAKSIKNGQCTIYVFDKDEQSLVDFRGLFGEGLCAVEDAIRHLTTTPVASDVPLPTWTADQGKAFVGNIGRSLGLVDLHKSRT